MNNIVIIFEKKDLHQKLNTYNKKMTRSLFLYS